MNEVVKFLHEQNEPSFRWTIRLPVPSARSGDVQLWPTEGDPLDLRDDGFLWRITRWLDRQTIEVDFREPVTGQAIVTYRPIHEPIGSDEGEPAHGGTLNVNPADRLHAGDQVQVHLPVELGGGSARGTVVRQSDGNSETLVVIIEGTYG